MTKKSCFWLKKKRRDKLVQDKINKIYPLKWIKVFAFTMPVSRWMGFILLSSNILHPISDSSFSSHFDQFSSLEKHDLNFKDCFLYHF